MQFIDKSCREFTAELSSRAPVPGGGGAAALVGALGTALGNMVGQLTIGKQKYADVEDEIKALMERADKMEKELLDLVDKDARAFEPLAKAYAMPKDTEEEKAAKEAAMEAAVADAAMVPLEIMRKCCETIDLQGDFAKKGSRLAVSDAGCGVIMCKAALQAASLNVYINTRIMKDKELADKIEREADLLLLEYTMKADEVYAYVFSFLRK